MHFLDSRMKFLKDDHIQLGQLIGGEVVRRPIRTSFLRTHQLLRRAQDEFISGHLNVLDFLRRAAHFTNNIENNLRTWANNIGEGNIHIVFPKNPKFFIKLLLST